MPALMLLPAPMKTLSLMVLDHLSISKELIYLLGILAMARQRLVRKLSIDTQRQENIKQL